MIGNLLAMRFIGKKDWGTSLKFALAAFIFISLSNLLWNLIDLPLLIIPVVLIVNILILVEIGKRFGVEGRTMLWVVIAGVIVDTIIIFTIFFIGAMAYLGAVGGYQIYPASIIYSTVIPQFVVGESGMPDCRTDADCPQVYVSKEIVRDSDGVPLKYSTRGCIEGKCQYYECINCRGDELYCQWGSLYCSGCDCYAGNPSDWDHCRFNQPYRFPTCDETVTTTTITTTTIPTTTTTVCVSDCAWVGCSGDYRCEEVQPGCMKRRFDESCRGGTTTTTTTTLLTTTTTTPSCAKAGESCVGVLCCSELDCGEYCDDAGNCLPNPICQPPKDEPDWMFLGLIALIVGVVIYTLKGKR